jgi:type I restriction enzyme, S subunit
MLGHQQALLVESRKEGTTVESIEHELLVNTRCLIPSISEQLSIVEYLDHETAKIDALIFKVRVHIERLKEYCAALISATVTGKIDVRREVA